MESEYKSHHILLIVLENDVKVEHENKWRTYCERITQIEKQSGQTLSIIGVHYMQVILDKTNHNSDWYTTCESCNLLTLIKLMEKKILAHMENQY